MGSLTQLILALAISNTAPGSSPFSLEVMPECGTDPRNPACELSPVCAAPSPYCKPPRWSPARKAWVRVESRSTALRRYAGIASAISDTAQRLLACNPNDERYQARCEFSGWPGSARTLAIATLAVALHESGLREDIQFGRPPAGRGPAGEACLVQIAPAQAPLYATWLPREERESIAKDRDRRELFARELLGDSPVALRHCFEIGMRMLARSRVACQASRQPWDFAMFSMYGTGRTCNSRNMAEKRQRTFRALLRAEPKLDFAELVGLGLAEAPDGS
jgi:hypothetical protein